MAYHIEHKGVALSSRQSDIIRLRHPGLGQSIETAVAERPTAALSVRVPPGVTLAPKDFDEVTIDYPALPYRAWSERHANLVAYWRLDEAAVTLAVDSKGATPLTYGGGNELQYRAFRSETSAVPYGGAPEWGHTSGNGLSGTLPTGIDPEWTIAGFLRLKSGSAGSRHAWFAGGGSRRLRVSADGSISCRFGTGTMTAPAGTITVDTWHHVALRRTATARELWVDRAMVDSQTGGGETLDGRTWTMAVALGGDAVDLALDEWGIWSEALDIAALYARRTHHRAFGGYVYGLWWTRRTLGRHDQHVLSLSLAGYGLRLDHSYVRQIYASASGSTIREIVQDVLERAGLDAVFTVSRRGAGRHDHPRRLPGPVGHDDSPLAGRPPRGHRDGRRVARTGHGSADEPGKLSAGPERRPNRKLPQHRPLDRAALLRQPGRGGRARRAGHRGGRRTRATA